MRHINKLVIHCSDTDDSLDFSARDIREWHLKRGWSDIGYHYVIRRNGRVETGRPLEIKGSHVRGENSDSIGICLVGRSEFDSKQMAAVKDLVRAMCTVYNLDPTEDVYGHYEFDINKTCPNLDMVKFRAEMLFHV